MIELKFAKKIKQNGFYLSYLNIEGFWHEDIYFEEEDSDVAMLVFFIGSNFSDLRNYNESKKLEHFVSCYPHFLFILKRRFDVSFDVGIDGEEIYRKIFKTIKIKEISMEHFPNDVISHEYTASNQI